MSLCTLCRTIPFASLPYPTGDFYSSIGNYKELQVTRHTTPTTKSDFFPWHTNLSSLATAAQTCPLCWVVEQGYQRWLEHFEEARHIDPQSLDEEKIENLDGTLWVTRRFKGGPGFVVLLHRGLNYNYKIGVASTYILLTGVCFSAEQGNPAAETIGLLPMLDADSGSVYNLNLAASYLDKCNEDHERCCISDSPLPTRVLDLGDGESVKVVERGAELGKYACLSYCWGDDLGVITTRDNINQRRTGFALQEMPKTLVDAVKIARHLSIPYLWVDCLCICQDDPADWARESERMGDIYSGAYLVIAATRAVSASEGCFSVRPERASRAVDIPGHAKQIKVSLVYNSNEFEFYHGSWESEPLSTRGWAFQERFMASRTLHYTTRQMYFECTHGIFGEDGSFYENRFGYLKVPRRPDSVQPGRLLAESGWHNIVKEYSMRRLTKPTDKLPALAGVVKFFAKIVGAEYVAGLWSNAILHGLAWETFRSTNYPVRPMGVYTGPSWSWAGYSGPATVFYSLRHHGRVAQALNWEANPVNLSNPFGEVSDAWVRIRAPMTALKPTRDIEDGSHSFEKPRFTTCYSGDEANYTDVVLEYRENEWRRMDLSVLLLEDTPEESEAKETKAVTRGRSMGYFGLVITPTQPDEKGTQTWERIGTARLTPEEAKMMTDDTSNRHIVMLV